MSGGILASPKRIAKLTCVVLVATMACASAPIGMAHAQSQEIFEVERVIDGDTIYVVGLGRVRLIGINAPESVHPYLSVQPCALAASVYLHQQLYRRRVGIEVSPVAGRDRYGRLLAYVWYRGLVNTRVVANGYATVDTYRPFVRRRQEFMMAQHYAQKRRLGIWNRRQCE